jgi:hypothetical protein
LDEGALTSENSIRSKRDDHRPAQCSACGIAFGCLRKRLRAATEGDRRNVQWGPYRHSERQTQQALEDFYQKVQLTKRLAGRSLPGHRPRERVAICSKSSKPSGGLCAWQASSLRTTRQSAPCVRAEPSDHSLREGICKRYQSFLGALEDRMKIWFTISCILCSPRYRVHSPVQWLGL